MTGGEAPRLGFVVDIVEFGRFDAATRADLRRRLDDLVRRVIADLGIDAAATSGSDTGDARLAFLPAGVDWSCLLPTMISAMGERLGRDNRRHGDRMRLRMSVATGPVSAGPLGFTGQLVVDLHRLVDSEVLRDAVRDHPDTDLAVLVSQALHEDVVRPGHLDPADFTPVTVTAAEFTGPAWLRLC